MVTPLKQAAGWEVWAPAALPDESGAIAPTTHLAQNITIATLSLFVLLMDTPIIPRLVIREANKISQAHTLAI